MYFCSQNECRLSNGPMSVSKIVARTFHDHAEFECLGIFGFFLVVVIILALENSLSTWNFSRRHLKGWFGSGLLQRLESYSTLASRKERLWKTKSVQQMTNRDSHPSFKMSELKYLVDFVDSCWTIHAINKPLKRYTPKYSCRICRRQSDILKFCTTAFLYYLFRSSQAKHVTRHSYNWSISFFTWRKEMLQIGKDLIAQSLCKKSQRMLGRLKNANLPVEISFNVIAKCGKILFVSSQCPSSSFLVRFGITSQNFFKMICTESMPSHLVKQNFLLSTHCCHRCWVFGQN